MNRFFLLSLFLLFVPFVSADFIVSPQNPSLSVTWYTPTVFYLYLNNNNSYSISNLTFSNIGGFSFPQSVDLNPYESKNISYSVSTNSLFVNQVFVSTLSFFYSISSPPPIRSFDVNVSAGGFSVFPVLMSNDSLVWHNLLSSPVTVRDLGSGFPEVVIPAGGSVSVSYLVPKNFSFYIVQSGIVGSFQVVPRSGVTFAHDSSLDEQLSFRLSSVLPTSTMQVSLLTENISVDNNGSYLEALIEVRNLDSYLVIRGVNISADRWVDVFSPNLFDIPAGGVQRVLFNITPFVDRTNLTNRSSKIILNVRSSNAGSTVKDIDVFIKYQNLDVVSIGGVNYTITLLNINQTIDACLQHMYDSGFERCLELQKFFTKNVTFIKEVPASYEFTQSQIKTYADSWSTLSGVAQRLENKQNLYLDRQSLTNLRVDNLSDALQNFSSYVLARESERDLVVSNRNVRFWVLFSSLGFICLMSLIVGLLSSIELFDALERAGQ